MNQRRYQKRIDEINSAFRSNLLKNPKKASRNFTHDLGETIRAFNASQLKKGMGNVQSNKQSSSGTALNQNRVIGGQGSKSDFIKDVVKHPDGLGLGGSQHYTPSRPNAINAPGGSIRRSPLYPTIAKGGPAGGKPIIPPALQPATKKQAINVANPGYAEALAQLKARRRRARPGKPYAA